MARRRMVDPEFWSDELISSLPYGARLLALGILNFADDGGVFPDSPNKLKNLVFPGDPVTAVQFQEWLDALVKGRYLLRFEENGGAFLVIRNWTKYQTINRPSSRIFAKPPPLLSNTHTPLTESSLSPHGVLTEPSVSTHTPLTPEVKLSKDKLREEKSTPLSSSRKKMIFPLKGEPAAAKKTKHPKPTFSLLKTPQDLLAIFSEDELTEAVRLFPKLDLEWEGGKCLDWHNARGGSGNWKLAYKNWLAKARPPSRDNHAKDDAEKYTQGLSGLILRRDEERFATQEREAQ